MSQHLPGNPYEASGMTNHGAAIMALAYETRTQTMAYLNTNARVDMNDWPPEHVDQWLESAREVARRLGVHE